MHGSHVGETTTCVANGEGGIAVAPKEEQPCVAQLWISLFLGLCIDVDETVVGMGTEIVAHLHRLVGVDVVIIRTLTKVMVMLKASLTITK